MSILFFDCFAGISGDMTLAALIDLGVPVRYLKQELKKLPLQGYSMQIHTEERMGVSGKKVTVKLAAAHHHRTLSDIQRMLNRSVLDTTVKDHSLHIFSRIAQAEAEVHHTTPDAVHFHEVGAVDSIIDIVGTAIAMQYLGIQTCSSTPLPLGRGFVTCHHGTLPLPAPATVLLLKGIPVYDAGIEGELVTPTGAAIISHYVQRFDGMPAMTIRACGYGVGHRTLPDRPNMLRLMLGDASEAFTTDEVVVLETNIDDMNPEYAGYVMERLLAAGALDVMFVPAYMKKNRPGIVLSVICAEHTRQKMLHILFQETTTAGVRSCRMQRSVLPRREEVVMTRFGAIQVKVITGPDGERIVPEFEACRRAAQHHNVPLRDVYTAVVVSGKQTISPAKKKP
ncbi:MAG: nickel pincer cofactor biosynthesis protein LarC [Desulfobacterota bacterium]|nr:nickel pincer cofactor biosynthesis protein LarC [Thermodesulfobacteriota bacterium]